jgi:hypothetical protein
MAAPKARKSPPTTATPHKELRPWQLVAFILMGLAIAGILTGFGYAKKTHDEYGQWPWARTPAPPKMYYDHRNYTANGTGSTTGLVTVGKTPGGGIIYAPSVAKTPVPTAIQVKKPSTGQVFSYTLVPKS